MNIAEHLAAKEPYISKQSAKRVIIGLQTELQININVIQQASVFDELRILTNWTAKMWWHNTVVLAAKLLQVANNQQLTAENGFKAKQQRL